MGGELPRGACDSSRSTSSAPRLEQQRALLQASSFGTFPRSTVDFLRRRGRLAEYGGVFAVEGEELLGQTLVYRFPYTYADGEGTLGGISLVVTRPDRARRGVATTILREVHDRERAEGTDRVGLWTNRSWKAHDLYEELGYRDVHPPPLAAHLGAPRRLPRRRGDPRVRAGRAGDLLRLERLHARCARGGVGFTPRRPGVLRTAARLQWFDPPKHLRVATEGGEPVGYAVIDRAPGRIACGELLGESAPVRELLVDDLQREAGQDLVTLNHAAVTTCRSSLERRGFSILDSSWIVLLGAVPGRRAPREQLVREFAGGDPRFVLHRWDRF